MKEIYQKFGRVVRRENAFLVRIDEAGESLEDDGTFSAAPIGVTAEVPDVDDADVEATARAIENIVAVPVAIERMIVSEGVAIHRCGAIEWSERTRRIHLSITNSGMRALIDLAEFSIDTVERVVRALARVSGERAQPPRLRLADNVGAALLPSISTMIDVHQWPAAHDGRGQWIESRRVTSELPPNWFRPSYRSRPVRAWFHLRAEAHGSIEGNVPAAVALLAPIHERMMRLLCVDGEEAFVTTASIDAITAVAPTPDWYPYGAGSFGAEMMLGLRADST